MLVAQPEQRHHRSVAMLEVLQKLFRAHPEGLTIDEIGERYRITYAGSTLDPATGKFVTTTREMPVELRHRRPKHIRSYLQRAIDLGMMRADSSSQGFRYFAFETFFSLVEDPRGQLVYAYDAENKASREEQARTRKGELAGCCKRVGEGDRQAGGAVI
jgi:hypothetical protein